MLCQFLLYSKLNQLEVLVVQYPMDCSLPGSLSMEFSRPEYQSGQPFPSPEDLPDSGLNPGLLNWRQILYHLSRQVSLNSYTYTYLCDFQILFLYGLLQSIEYSLFYNSRSLVIIYFISVQFSSVTQSCATLCDPMDRSTPGLPVHHQLIESTQTHVHCVDDASVVSFSVVPFSPCPQSFPASGSFQMTQLSASGSPSIGVSASASVLPMNTQD